MSGGNGPERARGGQAADDPAAYRRMVRDLVDQCLRRLAGRTVPADVEPLLGWRPRDD